MDRQTIRDFTGRIIGFIDTDPRGDKTVRDFTGRILGYYRKGTNTTTDFTGRIIANGDCSSSLLYR